MTRRWSSKTFVSMNFCSMRLTLPPISKIFSIRVQSFHPSQKREISHICTILTAGSSRSRCELVQTLIFLNLKLFFRTEFYSA